MNVIILKGLQASGKSTWAKQFITEHQDYKCVNRDAFRFMLSNYTFDDKNEKLVTKLEDDVICSIIDSGYNLVIDAMHLNQKYLEIKIRWIKEYCVQKHNYQVDFEIKEFPITLMEAIQRDKSRAFPIGESVIKNTWRKYEIELKQMIARSEPIYEDADKDLPLCVICDIDGTLADSTNRRVHDESMVHTDKVIEPVADVLTSYAHLAMVYIFIFSGRKDSCEEQTSKWLKDHDIPFHKLFMRKADDNRKDTIVKEEIYNEHIKGKYKVLFVVDDRPAVLEMWSKLGLFTLNVNQDVYAKNDF